MRARLTRRLNPRIAILLIAILPRVLSLLIPKNSDPPHAPAHSPKHR